jgi:hypothetical protein
VAQQVHVLDAVRAGDHPRDLGRHLQRRVGPALARHPHVLTDQVVETSDEA